MNRYWQCPNPMHKARRIDHGPAVVTWRVVHDQCFDEPLLADVPAEDNRRRIIDWIAAIDEALAEDAAIVGWRPMPGDDPDEWVDAFTYHPDGTRRR